MAAVFLAVLAPALWLVGTIWPAAGDHSGAAAAAWYGIRAAGEFSGHVLVAAAAAALALTAAVLLPMALAVWRWGGGRGRASIGRPSAGSTARSCGETPPGGLDKPSRACSAASPDHAADDRQGFPLVPPRSAAMVPVLIFGALIVVYFFNVPSFTTTSR